MAKSAVKPSKPKPVGDREALIDWRLEFMTNQANGLKIESWNEVEAARKNRYIRINGESYRAVSLADDSPLSKFAESGACQLATIERHFDKKLEPKDGQWLEKKRERRLQSRIIQQALSSKRNMLIDSLFGKALERQFDELIFALDEVSFGDANHTGATDNSRCDLVAVGRIGSDTFPVVIELKSERSLGRLFEQLDDASREIERHQEYFGKLLKALTGISVSIAEVHKILVWPALVSGHPDKKTTIEKCEKKGNAGMLFIEYSPEKFSSASKVAYSLKTY